MEVRIVEKEQMLLVGLSFFGDPFKSSAGWTEENEIGRLWVRFMTYLENQGARIQHIMDPEVSYEVHIEHPETQAKGEYEVFVGLEVEQLQDEIPNLELALKFTDRPGTPVEKLNLSVEEWKVISRFQRKWLEPRKLVYGAAAQGG